MDDDGNSASMPPPLLSPPEPSMLHTRLNGRAVSPCVIEDEQGTITYTPVTLRLFYEPLHQQALVRLRIQVDDFDEPFYLEITPEQTTCASFAPAESRNGPSHILFHVDEILLIAHGDSQVSIEHPGLAQLRRLAQQPIVRIRMPARRDLPDLGAFCQSFCVEGVTIYRGVTDIKSMYKGKGGRVINNGDRALPSTHHDPPLPGYVAKTISQVPKMSSQSELPSKSPSSSPSPPNYIAKTTTTSQAQAAKLPPKKRLRTRSPSPSSSPSLPAPARDSPSLWSSPSLPALARESPTRHNNTAIFKDAKELSELLQEMKAQEYTLRNLSAEVDMKYDQMAKAFEEACRAQETRESSLRELLYKIESKHRLVGKHLDEIKVLQANHPDLHAQSLPDNSDAASSINQDVEPSADHQQSISSPSSAAATFGGHDPMSSLISTAPPFSFYAVSSSFILPTETFGDTVYHTAVEGSMEYEAPPPSGVVAPSVSSVSSDESGIPDEIKAYIDKKMAKLFDKIGQVDNSLKDLERTWDGSAWDKQVWDAIDKSTDQAADIALKKLRDKLLYSGLC